MTMDCTDIRNRLPAYLDQELDAANVAAIDQHLAACEACSAAFARQSGLRRALREQLTYHRAPAGLASRIRSQVTRSEPRRFLPRWLAPAGAAVLPRQWLQFGAAVAATAVVTWMAAVEFQRPAPDELLAEQVIAGHARAVLTSHIADVATSDQHTVKPWLSSKLDFSPPVTDLTGVGFPLLGGRLDYLDNRPVAALAYQHRQHLISLFVWPERDAARSAPMRAFSRQGYNALHWTDAGMTYWAISDLNGAELRDFAQAYASAK
jgi:mycothiol system anti-sigma-R factor